MKVHVTRLTKRENGGYGRTREMVEAASVRLGRGTTNEIHLADLRVGLEHAQFTDGGAGRIFFGAMGERDFIHNDAHQRQAELTVGDIIHLGPYELKILEPMEGADIGVSIELVQPLGEVITTLAAQSGMSLASVAPSKRSMAWLFSLIILGVFLAWPVYSYIARSTGAMAGTTASARIGGYTADSSWLSGEMSSAHKPMGDDCGACHEKPFVMVRDEACATCHSDVRHHADPARMQKAMAGMDPVTLASMKPAAILSGREERCGSCHKEHNGSTGLIPVKQRGCSDCHANLAGTVTDTALKDVRDFGTSHPQFRPTILQDPWAPEKVRARIALPQSPELVDDAAAPAVVEGLARLGIEGPVDGARKGILAQVSPALWKDPGLKPVENSGLKFPHDRHLKKGNLVARMNNDVNLTCATCHKTEPGGQGMLPINMEENCGSCHTLNFDERKIERRLPHGKPREVAEVVRDYYARIALTGEAADRGGPLILRRRPGESRIITDEQRKLAQDWAEDQAARKIEVIFTAALCWNCHSVQAGGKDVVRGTPADPATAVALSSLDNEDPDAPYVWDIKRPDIADTWMPKARFSHSSHETMVCQDCHAAEFSAAATDVLIPGIENCRGCHQGETATAAVPSTCVLCHDFHGDAPLPPMVHKPQGTLAALEVTQ